MTQFVYQGAGNSEAQQRLALSFLLEQDSAGIATDGVLTGLAVAQTATASASVVVGKGAGVAQDSLLNGAGMLVLDSDLTLDVLTANPMGGVPRNDLVVFDGATLASGTGGVRVITGTPNASPTDPSIPATAVPLARLRHAASATTVPTSAIDSLRVKVSLFGAADESNNIRGVPFAGASTTKAAKRLHWGTATVTTAGPGLATVTHGAGFTPSVVIVTASDKTWRLMVDTFTSTTFRLKTFDGTGALYNLSNVSINYLCGE